MISSRFVASARQLAKALEVPLVNDLGYTKRYVRCLQVILLFSWTIITSIDMQYLEESLY